MSVSRLDDYYQFYKKIDKAIQRYEEVYEEAYETRLLDPHEKAGMGKRYHYIHESPEYLEGLIRFAQKHFKTMAKTWIDKYQLIDSFETIGIWSSRWTHLPEEEQNLFLISTREQYGPRIRKTIDNLRRLKADLQRADEKSLGPDVRAALKEKASSIWEQLEGIKKQTAGVRDLLANLQAQEVTLKEDADKVMSQLAAITLKGRSHHKHHHSHLHHSSSSHASVKSSTK